MTIAVILNYMNVSPIKALYWSAVLNGLLAPFLLVGILIIACNSSIMRGQPSSMTSRVVVGIAIVVMFGALAGMFVF
jgi:Mn2+/Fe2+ NRAMP family transporter